MSLKGRTVSILCVCALVCLHTQLDEDVDRQDLEEIDKLCVQALDELKKVAEDGFEDVFMESFCTQVPPSLSLLLFLCLGEQCSFLPCSLPLLRS